MSMPMTSRSSSRIHLLAAVAAAISLAACGDLTGVSASYSNISDTVTVYTLNGAPLGAPTALYVYGATILAANSSFDFDIAFDIAGAGLVTILPVRAVASSLVSTHAVGLATVADTFEAVNAVAKGTSFRADTALTIERNQVLLVQVDESGSACASSSTGSNIYAKVVVRAIHHDTGTMDIQFAVDPNCGFRSFADGVPKFDWRPTRRTYLSSR